MFRKAIIGAIIVWPLLLPAQPAEVPGKHRMCFEVFDRLVTAYARIEPSIPRLQIVPGHSGKAETTHDGRILIDEGMIEVCRKMGKDSMDAMAFIIGHELAHHYNHHFWASHFGTAFADERWGQMIDSLGSEEEFIQFYETQADDFGLFFAYVAGYQPFGISEKLYRTIYETFGLPDKLKGYPALEERIRIAAMAEERVAKLVPIFKAGKYLYILSSAEEGKYKEMLLGKSRECFEALVDRKMVNREIFNNLGVVYLQLALAILDKQEYPYNYPVVFDEDSRIIKDYGSATGTKGHGWADVEARAMQYLGNALRYLDQATDLDPSYGIGYLNQCIGYFLSKQQFDADYYLEKARMAALANRDDMLLAACMEMEAIMLTSADVNRAITVFNKAEKLGSPLSATNRTIAQKGPAGGQTVAPVLGLPGFGTRESVLGSSLQDIYNEAWRKMGPDNRFRVAQGGYFFMYQEEQGEFYLSECHESSGCPFRALVFFEFNESYNQPTAKGIKKGDNMERLKSLYGKESMVVTTGTWTYYLYKGPNILFQVRNDGTVANWIIYYYI